MNPGLSHVISALPAPLPASLGVPKPAWDGPEMLHIMGPGSGLGHARPASAWLGEEGKAGRALTELGFGGRLSSSFGCSWGPRSWRGREVGQGCHPWRTQRLLRPTYARSSPAIPPGPIPMPGPTPAPGPNPARGRRTNPQPSLNPGGQEPTERAVSWFSSQLGRRLVVCLWMSHFPNKVSAPSSLT